MITGYVTHEEAMIKEFMSNPEYADEMLSVVLSDGDEYEKQRIKDWYEEAQTRRQAAKYWENLIENTERAVERGENVNGLIELMNKALKILKSASTQPAAV